MRDDMDMMCTDIFGKYESGIVDFNSAASSMYERNSIFILTTSSSQLRTHYIEAKKERRDATRRLSS